MMIKNKEQQKRVSEFLYEHRNSLKIPLPEIKSNIENDFYLNEKQYLFKQGSNR